MANFTWTNAGGGYWAASNWSHDGIIGDFRPPEFGGDTAAFFGDPANSYDSDRQHDGRQQHTRRALHRNRPQQDLPAGRLALEMPATRQVERDSLCFVKMVGPTFLQGKAWSARSHGQPRKPAWLADQKSDACAAPEAHGALAPGRQPLTYARFSRSD